MVAGVSAAAGYLALLDGLLTLDATPEAKEAFRKLIQERLDAERSPTEQRIDFAREMLNKREPVPIIRERIQVRFSVSRRQSYRDIEAALSVPRTWHRPNE